MRKKEDPQGYCSVCRLSGFIVRAPFGLKMCFLHDRLKVRMTPEEREIAFAAARQDAQFHTAFALFLPTVKEIAVLKLLES